MESHIYVSAGGMLERKKVALPEPIPNSFYAPIKGVTLGFY